MIHMKKISLKKKIVFSIIIFIACVIAIDSSLQILFIIFNGEFTWVRTLEPFNLEGSMCWTEDERYVTLNKNYQNDFNTDEYGFRTGENKPSELKSNIVFIGDSVPFGYGVESHNSVPSILSEILHDKGKDVNVINAAIPSYSLDQAVHRYKYEISGKFPVDVVILQIFDPASQFSRLGREWDVSINSATYTRRCRRKGILPPGSFLQYSALYYLYWKYLSPHSPPLEYKLDPNDFEAITKYTNSINHSLDILYREAEGIKAILILPITVPRKTRPTLPIQFGTAIKICNQVMFKYAQSKPRVYFLDTLELFDFFEDKSVFIDPICHLSPRGARLQADFIAEVLSKLKNTNNHKTLFRPKKKH